MWVLKIEGKLFDETFLLWIASVKAAWSAVVNFFVAVVSIRSSAMHLVLSLLSHGAKSLAVSTRPPIASCIVNCEKFLDFVTRVFTLKDCYCLAFGRGKTCRMTAVTGTLPWAWTVASVMCFGFLLGGMARRDKVWAVTFETFSHVTSFLLKRVSQKCFKEGSKKKFGTPGLFAVRLGSTKSGQQMSHHVFFSKIDGKPRGAILCHRIIKCDRFRIPPFASVRFGEAKNPGPRDNIEDQTALRIAVTNPTSVYRKTTFLQALDCDLLALSETSATWEVQRREGIALRQCGYTNVWGAPVSPQTSSQHGDSLRGASLGVSIHSR